MTMEHTICTSFPKVGDPNDAFLTLGENDEERVRVPLAEQGPPEIGIYAETPLDQTVKFKTADLIVVSETRAIRRWLIAVCHSGRCPRGCVAHQAARGERGNENQPRHSGTLTVQLYSERPPGLYSKSTGELQ
jgi:hypothetical protein